MQPKGKRKIPRLLGILNVTPDSFSDAARYFDPLVAEARALELIEQGAEMIDIGGDSTRPGSRCVGVSEELRRIEAIVLKLAAHTSVSVDTHHAKVAERCLQAGALMINDVSAGAESEILRLVSASSARIVLMFMAYAAPHDFSNLKYRFSIETVHSALERCVERAMAHGVRREQIILDTGMGAFLSPNAADSWKVINEYQRFSDLGFELLLGCSRKGFLKLKAGSHVEDLDELSALAAVKAYWSCGGAAPDWIRVHNVAIHKAFFDNIVDQAAAISRFA